MLAGEDVMYMFVKAGRQAGRQTDRQAGRQKDKMKIMCSVYRSG